MHPTIKILRTSENGLEFKTWTFMLFEFTLILDTYLVQHKESLKHKKLMLDEDYNRLNQRDSSLKEEEVPLPEDVIEEARKEFIAKMKVSKWGAYKNK